MYVPKPETLQELYGHCHRDSLPVAPTFGVYQPFRVLGLQSIFPVLLLDRGPY